MVDFFDNIKITTIGGGTGNSNLLRGLKIHFSNISTIVAMTDNGGNSGFLRENFGVVPPGDVRACIAALSTNSDFDRFINYRFDKGSLNGVSVGNLMLTALNDINGDFYTAVKTLTKMSLTAGDVLPISTDNIDIVAEFEDGTTIKGEKEISSFISKYNRINRVYIEPLTAKPLYESIQRILESDIILIAPGSLFTSTLANLIFDEVKEALNKTNAKIYYVMNIMTQSYETFNFRVIDHINMILKHCNGIKIEGVFVNNGYIDSEIIEKYKREKSVPIKMTDEEKLIIKNMGINIIENNYVNIENECIRHNVSVVVNDLLEIFKER